MVTGPRLLVYRTRAVVHLKAVELANLTSPTPAQIIGQTHRGTDLRRALPLRLPLGFSWAVLFTGISDSVCLETPDDT